VDNTNFDELPYLSDLSVNDWLTIALSKVDNNHVKFENLCLYTSCVFIGDVDIEEDENEISVINRIRNVARNNNTRFRIYKTFKGFRVFYVETQVRVGEYLANKLFSELMCDRKYIEFCNYLGTFAARISPKATRKEDPICVLVDEGNPILDPKIFLTVTLHDYFCVYDENWCNQWRLYNSK